MNPSLRHELLSAVVGALLLLVLWLCGQVTERATALIFVGAFCAGRAMVHVVRWWSRR